VRYATAIGNCIYVENQHAVDHVLGIAGYGRLDKSRMIILTSRERPGRIRHRDFGMRL
jgi:hypothetical protein